MTEAPETTAYTGWAVLELMGHRRLAGYVSEAAQYGTAQIRIDIPTEDGQPPITQFYGGASIYCLTPVTEEAARAVAKHHRPAPVQPYELAPPTQALTSRSRGYEDEDEGELRRLPF